MNRPIWVVFAAVFAGFLGIPALADEGNGGDEDLLSNVDIEVQGEFVGAAGYVDEDNEGGSGKPNQDFEADGRLNVTASTVLDSGLQIGISAEVQLDDEGRDSALADSDNSDHVDFEYDFFIDGAFGRAEFGEEDGAGDKSSIIAPDILGGQYLNDPRLFFQTKPGAAAPQEVNTIVDVGDDDLKVMYFTPRVAGVRLGVSYAPQTEHEEFKNAVQVGLTYVKSFDDLQVQLGAAYGTAGADKPAVGGPTDDAEEWQVGANLLWGGFTFGGSYLEGDNSANNGRDPLGNHEETNWDVGASYTTGPWSFGAIYGKNKRDIEGASFDTGLNALEVAVNYMLSPGISIGGGYFYFDYDGGPLLVDDNAANNFVIETALKF